MTRHILLIAASALPLSACATASFAPPGIKVNYADGSGSTMTCAQAADRTSDRTVTVERDVDGALTVVETYIDAYDCSARAAADGRQIFEVPGVLTATGAAVAAALGAGPDLAVLATGAGSLMNAGKAYYDPKKKALVYSHAVDALRCIRSESMGIDNFATFKKESTDATNAFRAARAGVGRVPNPTVSIAAHQQYFVMVTDAVGAVSGVLGDNLSNVGTFNPAGTLAELKKLLEEIAAKEKEKKDKKDNPPQPHSFRMEAGRLVPIFDRREIAAYEADLIDIDLKLLQPKLQTCIWRAKV